MSVFRRMATKPQKWMIWSMVGAYGALLTFLVIEIIGITNSQPEDTLSEWVWDLPFPAVASIATLFLLTGAIFIWAGGHFLEGYGRRRKIEQGKWREEPPSS